MIFETVVFSLYLYTCRIPLTELLYIIYRMHIIQCTLCMCINVSCFECSSGVSMFRHVSHKFINSNIVPFKCYVYRNITQNTCFPPLQTKHARIKYVSTSPFMFIRTNIVCGMSLWRRNLSVTECGFLIHDTNTYWGWVHQTG